MEEVFVLKARIKFRKYSVMRFIGHLDVMRFFQKVMRRADIPIKFTGGYSPHMIMSFAQPLGVGITSDGEYLDIELTEPILSETAVRQMNKVMVEGIDVLSFVEIPDDKKHSGMTIVAAADYHVFLLASEESADSRIAIPDSWIQQAKEFLAQDTIVVMKKTKRSEKEVDIKPMIYFFEVDSEKISLRLATGSEQNLKPDLVMSAFLSFINEDTNRPMHYHRVDVYAKTEDGFASLDSLGRWVE